MVPPEAVKGLRYKNGTWLLYASDPEPMAVSAFRLRKEALEAAAYEIQKPRTWADQRPLTPEDAEKLMDWLLYQPFIRVELVESEGVPSMFPSFLTAGPKPEMSQKPPIIDR